MVKLGFQEIIQFGNDSKHLWQQICLWKSFEKKKKENLLNAMNTLPRYLFVYTKYCLFSGFLETKTQSLEALIWGWNYNPEKSQQHITTS